MPAIAPDCCLKTILGKYLVLTDAPFFNFYEVLLHVRETVLKQQQLCRHSSE